MVADRRRAGRFGAYVNHGKVNATIPKSISPDEITLSEAVALIAERDGRPARASARKVAKPKDAGMVDAAAACTHARHLNWRRHPAEILLLRLAQEPERQSTIRCRGGDQAEAKPPHSAGDVMRLSCRSLARTGRVRESLRDCIPCVDRGR